MTATLSFVSPAVDTNNGTVLARALLPADSGLRPGQFVPLQIVTAVHTNCLAAPDESVVTDESGHSVIALVKGDEAAQTPVQTGLRENGWVEIEGAGLKEGDSVVTVGAYGLPEKTKIQVVESVGRRNVDNQFASPSANEARRLLSLGPVRHAARAVHHVHRGGVVPGGSFFARCTRRRRCFRRRIFRASSSW